MLNVVKTVVLSAENAEEIAIASKHITSLMHFVADIYIYILVKKNLSKFEKEYRDCIKRKWRQDWGHYDTSCGPMSSVPMRKDGVPEFVFKLLYCRAVV